MSRTIESFVLVDDNVQMFHETIEKCTSKKPTKKKKKNQLNSDSLDVNEIKSFQHGLMRKGLYKGVCQTLDLIFVTLQPPNPKRGRGRERERERER
jgi:hypothetical protein